jgi:hypothetical protein
MKARAALGLASLLLACSKKAEPPRRTEPWLASPSASVASETSTAPRTFRFTEASSVRFSLPARKARPAGSVRIASGYLTLDPRQLERARAKLEVDLTQLVMDESSLPQGADLGGRSGTALAQEWLELGAEVAVDKRAQLARARFELVSVESLSASTLQWEPGAKNKVRASVVGTLLIHGFRAPVRAEVVLEPLAPSKSGRPRLSIRSASPLVLPLGPHDIVARNAAGSSDPVTAARAAEWVGKSARLELELVAEAEAMSSNIP